MSSNVLTRSAAKATFGTKRSTQSMNSTKSIARYVASQCVRFTQALGFNLRELDSIQQISSATRSSQGNANIGSDQGFYLNKVKTLYTSRVRFTARSHRGFSASPKGLACAVAVAIGISLFLPMEQVSQASIVPMKSFKAYAKERTTHKHYVCLSKLWGKESAWNPLADNPKSTAFGIPQILGLKTHNPYKQIDLGLKYIKHRYTNPCKAWSFHQRKGWY